MHKKIENNIKKILSIKYFDSQSKYEIKQQIKSNIKHFQKSNKKEEIQN